MTSISRIDYGHAGEICRDTGCTFAGVSNHDQISVILQNADSISNAFALCRGRCRGIRRRQNLTSQSMHGRFKRKTCPRTRFKKERRQNKTVGEIVSTLNTMRPSGIVHYFKKPVGKIKNVLHIVNRQVVNGNDASRHVDTELQLVYWGSPGF